MGKIYNEIDARLASFIKKQKMFFVATAPRADNGHVNLSPKGCDGSFAILNPLNVAYVDRVGSGIETIAHIQENKRITIMFCAFQGPPRILRLYGQGQTLTPDHHDFAQTADHLTLPKQPRAIIRVKLTRIAYSCGYGIPLYEYQRDRDTLDQWADNQSPDQLSQYIADNNALSIDGLTGIKK